MDPQVTLDQAERYIRKGTTTANEARSQEAFREAADKLEDYWAWRNRGGFEPPGGDARAHRLANELSAAWEKREEEEARDRATHADYYANPKHPRGRGKMEYKGHQIRVFSDSEGDWYAVVEGPRVNYEPTPIGSSAKRAWETAIRDVDDALGTTPNPQRNVRIIPEEARRRSRRGRLPSKHEERMEFWVAETGSPAAILRGPREEVEIAIPERRRPRGGRRIYVEAPGKAANPSTRKLKSKLLR
jgi:hypothetical protein